MMSMIVGLMIAVAAIGVVANTVFILFTQGPVRALRFFAGYTFAMAIVIWGLVRFMGGTVPLESLLAGIGSGSRQVVAETHLGEAIGRYARGVSSGLRPGRGGEADERTGGASLDGAVVQIFEFGTLSDRGMLLYRLGSVRDEDQSRAAGLIDRISFATANAAPPVRELGFTLLTAILFEVQPGTCVAGGTRCDLQLTQITPASPRMDVVLPAPHLFHRESSKCVVLSRADDPDPLADCSSVRLREGKKTVFEGQRLEDARRSASELGKVCRLLLPADLPPGSGLAGEGTEIHNGIRVALCSVADIAGEIAMGLARNQQLSQTPLAIIREADGNAEYFEWARR